MELTYVIHGVYNGLKFLVAPSELLTYVNNAVSLCGRALASSSDVGAAPMPRLADEKTIAVFIRAFTDAQRFGQIVTWKPQAAENARHHLPGFTTQFIQELILEHLNNGREIRYAKETRDDWLDCGFHYDFILTPSGHPKIYVETVLVSDKIDDPRIHIVSCHKAD